MFFHWDKIKIFGGWEFWWSAVLEHNISPTPPPPPPRVQVRVLDISYLYLYINKIISIFLKRIYTLFQHNERSFRFTLMGVRFFLSCSLNM